MEAIFNEFPGISEFLMPSFGNSEFALFKYKTKNSDYI